MSVLIKGMEMPKDCVACRWHTRWGCEIAGIVTNTAQGCPLVEVPTPHGRLVDIDEVYRVLSKQYHHTTDLQHTALREALAKGLTVLEAEGGEDDEHTD